LGNQKSLIYLRRVVGMSMWPTLRPDQLVIAWRWGVLRPGALVIIRHGGLEKIKRLQQLTATTIFVLGDNPDVSTDSRNFGWLPRSAVVAKVVWPRAPRKRTISSD
jgi:nickel-type superoxide dismutase maturation protease